MPTRPTGFTSAEQARSFYRELVHIANSYKAEATRTMVEAGGAVGLAGTVKFAHYDIVCGLYHAGGGPLTPSEISAAVQIALPNVSTALAELVELGIVERDADEADRRRSTVRFTDLGARFADAVVERLTWHTTMFAGIDIPTLLAQLDAVEHGIETLKAQRQG